MKEKARIRNLRRLTLALLLSGSGVIATQTVSAAEAVSYRYDDLGRVIRVEYVGGPNDGLIIEYSYDAAGNRTAVVVS